jgi:hypothetical protein
MTNGNAFKCPRCGTSQTAPHSRYCEACRYDFQLTTGSASTDEATQIDPTACDAWIPPPARPRGPAAGRGEDSEDWEVAILVDPSLWSFALSQG